MDARDAHPSSRDRRLTAGQKTAAMLALRQEGEQAMAGQVLTTLSSSAELTLGFQVVIEQLAVELAHVTDRTPEQVLRDIAMVCAAGLAHPE